MKTPLIAVGPDHLAELASGAVEAGGGRLAAWPDSEAAIWMSYDDVAGLKASLAAAPRIRWVQLPWAGVETYAEAGVFDDGRTWTCGKGVYAEEVAEHALALTLGCLRHLPDRARADRWGDRSLGVSLLGRRVCVLGGGGITESFLRLLAPFRCDVTVVRRNPGEVPGATRTVTVEHLHEVLPGADVLVVALALTPETHRIIGPAELALLPDGAVVVNVARGAHVDTDALVDALESGHLGGAGIDVTDPEPLPDGHPLFSLPNTVVTCHSANTPEMGLPVLLKRITENVRRWAAGEALLGYVDPEQGY